MPIFVRFRPSEKRVLPNFNGDRSIRNESISRRPSYFTERRIKIIGLVIYNEFSVTSPLFFILSFYFVVTLHFFVFSQKK